MRCNSRGCWGAGRQRAAARKVAATLADNALQLTKLLRRWPTMRCNSRRCYGAGRQHVAARTLLRRWPTTRCSSRRYYDTGRHRAAIHGVIAALAGNAITRDVAIALTGNAATRGISNGLEPWPMLRCSVFVFFLFDNFKKEKEWEKERSFDTCSLVSRLHLFRLRWL
jgi:hypothetical protein